MISKFIGHLDHNDPLHGYLREHIVPQLGIDAAHASFRVFQATCSRDVYLYEEVHSNVRLVGKFYPAKNSPGHERKGEIEFSNLLYLRGLGFDAPPCYVVKPLGFNRDINNVLIMEFLAGDSLGKIINEAMYLGRVERLYRKLSGLAYFLASLHNKTAGEYRVDFNDSQAYLGRLIASLVDKRGLGRWDSDELYYLRETWGERGQMWQDRSVLVHGDVTPSNFLFGRGETVLAIDLERMRWADRVFDLGRLCGELAHFFLQGKGDRAGAEPFIGHFLWEYCRHFPDRQSAFAAVTGRIPFYMGITLLRIARNSWIDWDYRWRLVREAKQILRATS